jgi:fibronectin type 3 domain-containing protein
VFTGLPAQLLGQTTEAFFTDATVLANTQYYYWVTTDHTTCGQSPASAVASAETLVPTVNDVSASTGLCDQIEISWTPVPEQATYHIYRYTADEPENAVEIGTDNISPFVDDDIIGGTTQYYYWVTAETMNCVGEEGEYSSVAVGDSVPTLPITENVFASQGSLCDEILIQWTATENADTFEIYRSLVSDFDEATLLNTVGGTTASYSDATALPTVTYYYWVVATNSCGGSPSGDGESGFVGELMNPETVTATDNLCGIVQLGWSFVSSADSYVLSQSDVDDFSTSSVIYSGPDTYFELSELPDQTYYYWVQTENNGCVTDAGSSVSGMALAITEIPTNVQASPETECGFITLTWDSSAQQVDTLYTVYRSEFNQFDPINVVGQTTGTAYVDESVLGGTTYYYWVTGENSCGISQESLVASGVPGIQATPPENVVASESGSSFFCNQVVITWLASPNADSYMVFRSESGDSSEAQLLIEDLTTTSYIDETAIPVVEYTYWVVGVTSCGPHELSEANSHTGSVGQLPPPANVTATNSGDGTANCGSVLVCWDVVSNAVSYRVYRSTTPDFATAVELEDEAQSCYIDNDFNDSEYDTQHYYWVASNGYFCTAPEITSTLAEGSASPPIDIPTGLVASQGTMCGQVQLYWDEVPNAIGYEIWRHSTESPGAATPHDTSETNTYSDLVESGTYYYWVKAINTCGSSGLSQSDSGYPAESEINSPTVSATQGTICDYIQVSWSTELSADTYFIHRSLNLDGSEMQDVGVVDAPTTTWADPSVDVGSTYYYWVTAQNSCDTSDQLETGQPGWLGELPAPTNVQASDGDYCGSVFITWDQVNNSVDYNVYRLEVGDTNDPTLIGSSNGATTFTDSNVDATTLYYYYVKSVNNTMCGESDFSSSDIGQSLPSIVIPTNVQATYNEQCGQITVSWEHDEELTTYRLYRSENDDIDIDGATPIAVDIVDTQYVDSVENEEYPIVDGEPYYYWVMAENACGLSDHTHPAALGYGGELDIPSPVQLLASPHCTSITLIWDMVEGANSYELTRYQTGGSGEIVFVANDGTQTTYIDSDVVTGVEYNYEVVAVNSCASSDPTDLVSSSPTAAAPPYNVNATDSEGNCRVTVIWDWPSEGDGTIFTVWRSEDPTTDNAYSRGSTSQLTWTDYEPLDTAYYFVKAFTTECGEGEFSSGDAGSPNQGLPNPGGVDASNGTHCDGIEVTWDPVPTADSYCVYRGESSAPQNASQQVCGLTSTSWLDTNVNPNTPYWYWITTEAGGSESCGLGSPDQGWPSEPIGDVQDLDATTCEPDYVIVTWWGVNWNYDVAAVQMPQPQGPTENQIIAEGVQSPFIWDAQAPMYYYVRPVTSCLDEVGEWEGPVFGNPSSCFGGDLPEGLLGDEPGDPTILIVPRDLNEGGEGRRSAGGRIGTDSRQPDAESAQSMIDLMPPWSLCLVGDAEITTDPTFIIDDSRWSLPLGGTWQLVGHEGYADLFFLGGSDWEHVRSLKVKEIESGVASTLLEDGIAAVVGTVPEAGSNVLITGVSHDDCDSDGVPDGCEILLGLSLDMNIDGVPDSCAADINGDGVVDSFDLIEVLQNFGITTSGHGDATGDGIVDQSDVLSVLMSM